MIIECINQSAIIGVIGTLSGVILGFILNLMIRIGKIKVIPNSLSQTIHELNIDGDPIEQKEINANTNSITINLNIDLYNTSSFNQKIGRDFKFIFKSKKKEILKEVFYVTESPSSRKKFKNINLKPNELLNYDLEVYINNNFETFLESNYYLEYKNSRNRSIRKKINKIHMLTNECEPRQ